MENQDSVSMHQQARRARAKAIGNLIVKVWQAVAGFVTQRHAKPKMFPRRKYYPWP